MAFGAGTWRWPEVNGSTRYHLWDLSRRGWKVVYVNPARRLHQTGNVWKADDRSFWSVTPRATVPFAPGKVPEKRVGQIWRVLASKRLAAEARRYCRELKMKPSYFWYGSPWHSLVCQSFIPRGTHLFHVYDELSESPYLSEAQQSLLKRWESDLITLVDLVGCSSVPQLETRSHYGEKCFLLENGISREFFERKGDRHRTDETFVQLEDKLRASRGSSFVYGGVVDHRIDASLIAGILEKFPENHLYFLGTLSSRIDKKLLELIKSHKRVHQFGPVPYSWYPDLLPLAGVLILPHLKNRFTRGMLSEKLTEYLSSGRPIVSINLSEVVRVSGESSRRIIYTAGDREQFLENLAVALSEEDESSTLERRRISERRLWENHSRLLEGKLLKVNDPLPLHA